MNSYVKSGVHAKVAQQHMRHAKFATTMDIYAKTDQTQQVDAVAAMPELGDESEAVSATGTCGFAHAPNHANHTQNVVTECPRMSPDVTDEDRPNDTPPGGKPSGDNEKPVFLSESGDIRTPLELFLGSIAEIADLGMVA